MPDGLLEPRPGSELDDDVTFSIPTTREAMTEKPDAITMEILRSAFFAVNWSSLAENSQTRENLIRKGYEFDSLPVPDPLRI
jgi:hypothetical protein